MKRAPAGHKDGKKHCSKCKRWLSLVDFGKNRSKWDGLAGECKKCVTRKSREYAKTERGKAFRKKYNSSRKGLLCSKKGHLQYRYGVTFKEYDRMLVAQNGVCVVCGQPETRRIRGEVLRLALDHDHDTGKVRGLLCAKCNMALGCVNDDKELLLQLAIYLERNQ